MSSRDRGQELDYYELRRRHQEYKTRARTARPEEVEKPAPAPKPAPEEALHPSEILDAPEKPKDSPADIPPEPAGEQDPLASFVLSDEEPEEDAMEYEDDQNAGANPFNSFIRFFHGVKDNISARREAKEEAELEALDDLSDEELEALDDLDGPDGEEIESQAGEDAPQPGAHRFRWHRGYIPEDVEDGGEDEDVEDVEDLDSLDGETDDAEDEYGEDYEGAEDVPRRGPLKRFLNLFVTRVDEDELDDVEEDEGEEEILDEDFDEDEPYGAGDAEDANEFAAGAFSESEGGQNMDDMNKPVPTAPEMKAGLETSGMTRRERRERAMRLAAEEAARRAQEEAEAAAAVAEPKVEASVVEPLFTDAPEAEEPAAQAEPAAEETVEPQESGAQESVVEEPTREFKPVSARTSEEKNSLFEIKNKDGEDEGEEDDEEDEEEEEPPRKGLFGRLFGRKRDEEEEDEEDEDEEDDEDDEEEEEEKPRRGLFGFRKKVEEDEEDEDEEDEEEEEDEDEDDEDEEEEEEKPRRGLFGFRKKVDDDDEDEDEEDDEEDEDEEDDEDDYDEDDEYEEYEDDEYDRYDEGPHRSIGYHIVGVLKWVVRIIVFLVICIIVLNFLYVAGTDNIVPAMRDALGEDSTAFRFLFVGYEVRKGREERAADQAAMEAELPNPDEEQSAEEPAETPLPEPTVELPSFDEGAADDAEAGAFEDVSVEEVPVGDASPEEAQATIG